MSVIQLVLVKKSSLTVSICRVLYKWQRDKRGCLSVLGVFLATLQGNTGLYDKSVGLVGNCHHSFSTAGARGGGTENFPPSRPPCFKFCHLPKVQSVPSACVKTEE